MKYDDNLSTMFKTDMEEIGVFGLKFHDMRRTGAQRAFDAGLPIHVIQRFLGHAEPRMTWRYINREPSAPTDAEMERRVSIDSIKRERAQSGDYSAVSARHEVVK